MFTTQPRMPDRNTLYFTANVELTLAHFQCAKKPDCASTSFLFGRVIVNILQIRLHPGL